MNDRGWMKGLWAVSVMAALVLSVANLYLGELNQDEGWYLYAARLVATGELPYVDFATTQGPVMPFVYAAAQPLVSLWGLAAGRLFTALLGFAAALSAAWLAARLTGQAASMERRVAALVAFALTGINVYQSYYTTVVKTYSLTALLLTLGFVALTGAWGRRGRLMALLSGALLALAAGTRASAVVVLPVVCLTLVYSDIRQGLRRSVLFATGAAVTLCILFVPFAVLAPRGLWFALVEYHAGRDVGGWITTVAYKAGFLSRTVQAYFPAFSLLTVLLVYRMTTWRGAAALNRGPTDNAEHATPRRDSAALLVATWLSVVAVSGAHFMAPFPYEDYQVIIYPLFASALAVGLISLVPSRSLPSLALVVVILSMFASASSPINQGWFVGKRDRIWWPLKKASPLRVLQQTAERVRELSQPGDLLLTQDPYLAVEAGLDVPRGMELGQFCYFPEWPRDKAENGCVLNREMMIELLEMVEAPVAAFSGYGLAIRSPQVSRLTEKESRELWRIVEERYAPRFEVEPFGQADTRLRVLVRRD